MNPLDRIQQIFTPDNIQKILEREGLKVIRIIKDRTRKGLDIDGNPFRAYTFKYMEYKQKLGFIKLSEVNLTLHPKDGMMGRIDSKVDLSDNSLTVYINSADKERLALYHNIEGAGKSRVIRRFWGLSDKEKMLISDDVQKQINQIIKQL